MTYGEPCRCERYADGISSFVAQTRAFVKVEAERDAAVAALGRVRALARHVIHTNNGAAQLIVLDDELLTALEPTDLRAKDET